ncbi:SDR family oxidoreductase [Nocardia sp. NPDC004654]|uniref:SDR family oxidoreductase n=1 Tax=Nocardia sp. NPDC004654 TaxID=3154776 RepID=UPI0033B8568E
MTMTILVTGGTGTLGKHVVPLLRAAGRDVRVLSRAPRPAAAGIEYVTGDLLTGAGITAAVAGVDTILHLAGGPKGDDVATHNLVQAAQGVRHLVYIGVIAAEELPLGYFRAKYEAEQAVIGSGVPYTVLRAAQFHDLALKTVRAMAKLPVVPAPGGLRWQSVDSREVAARLVDLTLDEPAGRVADLAGPEVRTLSDMIRDYLRATGKRRALLPVRVPGKVGRLYRAGANLNLDTAEQGKRTWAEFLAEQLAKDQAAPVR